MLAHELRNPLAPIVNALHVRRPRRWRRAATSVARAHATMDRQVRHLIRLVDDLLDVSRITQGKIELRRERIDAAGGDRAGGADRAAAHRGAQATR